MKTLTPFLTLLATLIVVMAQPAGPQVPTPEQLDAINQRAVSIPAQEPAAVEEEEVFPAGSINFPALGLDEVLEVYADLVERTILQPATLPAQTITLVTQTPLTRSEAIQAMDAVLALNGISMINIGDKFVKAVPMQQAGQEGAPVSQLDVKDLADLGQYLTHVVQLKNVPAAEVIPALQPFAKIPNAILPIESSNMLVLRDYTENVKRMLEMLERIDVAVDSAYVSEVIPIKYALASDIANALNSLSTGGGATTVGSSSGTSGASGNSSRTSFRNNNSRNTSGFGGNQNSLNRSVNPYSESVTPQQVQPGASSNTFADRLRSIVNRAGSDGELEILGEMRIIADERSNALLLFASKRDMAMIKDIISKLDVVLAQVLIEALVIEVGLGDTLDYGISYLQNPQGSASAWSGAGGVFNNVNFFDPEAIRNATNLIGGFSYYLKYQDDFLVAITAAATDNNVSILSRPRVQTSHAVEANIFVGETRPYPTGSGIGFGGNSYSQIQQQRIGIELNVLPLINPDGLVVMDISQDIQSVGGEVLISGVGAVPITQDRSASAKVAVKSGETIILGGFISADKSTSRSGVPFLKDIPGLGILFRAQSNKKSRKELMIFIKPTVLETPEIAAKVAMEEKNKMPGVLGAERALTKDYNEAMRKVSEDAGIDYKEYQSDLDSVE